MGSEGLDCVSLRQFVMVRAPNGAAGVNIRRRDGRRISRWIW